MSVPNGNLTPSGPNKRTQPRWEDGKSTGFSKTSLGGAGRVTTEITNCRPTVPLHRACLGKKAVPTQMGSSEKKKKKTRKALKKNVKFGNKAEGSNQLFKAQANSGPESKGKETLQPMLSGGRSVSQSGRVVSGRGLDNELIIAKQSTRRGARNTRFKKKKKKNGLGKSDNTNPKAQEVKRKLGQTAKERERNVVLVQIRKTSKRRSSHLQKKEEKNARKKQMWKKKIQSTQRN